MEIAEEVEVSAYVGGMTTISCRALGGGAPPGARLGAYLTSRYHPASPGPSVADWGVVGGWSGAQPSARSGPNPINADHIAFACARCPSTSARTASSTEHATTDGTAQG